MRLIYLSVLLLFLASCSSNYYAKKAEEKYNDLQFKEAKEYYQEAVRKKPKNDQYRVELAKTYLKLGSYQEAIDIVSDIDDKSISSEVYFLLARINMADEKYDAATEYLKEAAKGNPDDQTIQDLLASIQNIDEFYQNTNNVDVSNIDIDSSNLNTFSPYIYKDTLFFSGIGEAHKRKDPWTGLNFSKLFISSYVNDTTFNKIRPFKRGIINKHHIANISFYDDGNKAIFSASQPDKSGMGLMFTTKFEETINLGIYEGEKNDGVWSQISLLPFVKKDNSYLHPSYSEESNVLYFASDMPGGYGGYDIYYVYKEDSTRWSEPINAGADINTPLNDLFPYNYHDSLLFFASEGHENVGGLDIFKAPINKHGFYSEICNIGNPINSPKDDFSIYLLNDSSGYFSSNRGGSDKIYHFLPAIVGNDTLLTYPTELFVQSIDGDPVEFASILINQSEIISTDSLGRVKYDLYADSGYIFIATKNGYFDDQVSLTTPKSFSNSQEYLDQIDLKLNPEIYDFSVNKNEFKNNITNEDLSSLEETIFFDFDSYTLRVEDISALKTLGAYILENENHILQILAHTDERGSDAYNMALSKKRAEATANFLLNLKVRSANLNPWYFGERNPVAKINHLNEREAEKQHQLNRRVELNFNQTRTDNLVQLYDAEKLSLPGNSLNQNNSGNIQQASNSFNFGPNWYVIAGSFKNEDNASAFVNTLVNQGYADAKVIKDNNSSYFKVAIAMCPSYEKAVEKKNELLNKPELNNSLWVFYHYE